MIESILEEVEIRIKIVGITESLIMSCDGLVC
jgi:hypothetical protein